MIMSKWTIHIIHIHISSMLKFVLCLEKLMLMVLFWLNVCVLPYLINSAFTSTFVSFLKHSHIQSANNIFPHTGIWNTKETAMTAVDCYISRVANTYLQLHISMLNSLSVYHWCYYYLSQVLCGHYVVWDAVLFSLNVYSLDIVEKGSAQQTLEFW